MTMTAKFDGKCVRCQQRFVAGTSIDWTRGVGATHETSAACAAAAGVVAAAPVVELNLKPVADFIGAARERGLKFPKARFLAPGGSELRLSVAGDKSRTPGAIQVVVRDQWLGRVTVAGVVEGRNLLADTDLLDTLRAIASDPAKAAREFAALMGRCSFCDKSITDEGSVEVGYGPVCAKRWGLPHTAKGTPVLNLIAKVA